MDALVVAVEQNATLRVLNVLGNAINWESVDAFIDAMRRKPTLTSLCGIQHDQLRVSFFDAGLSPEDLTLLTAEIAMIPISKGQSFHSAMLFNQTGGLSPDGGKGGVVVPPLMMPQVQVLQPCTCMRMRAPACSACSMCICMRSICIRMRMCMYHGHVACACCMGM